MKDLLDKFAKQTADRIDQWCLSNGVTIKNAKKFKMKIKHGLPEYIRDGNSITVKSNSEYTIYPARGRNAKKPISTLTI